MRLKRSCAFAAAILYATSLLAAPTDYTFRNVVDTSAGVFTVFDRAGLNNNGQLVFTGTLASGVTGIFSGANPATDTFADSSPASGYRAIGGAAINDSGAIVFYALVEKDGTDLPGIFNGPSASANVVVPPGGAYVGFNEPVINNAGKIAFWGARLNGPTGVFTGPNPASDTVADSSNYPYIVDTSIAINNNGTVAFAGASTDSVAGIFTGPDPAVDNYIESSPLIGAIRNFAINDRGDVIFAAQLIDETRTVLTGPNPLTDQYPLDAYTFAGDYLALNNNGDVAFDGELPNQRLGIFTGPDPADDSIIVSGDALFGSTVERVFFHPDGFNDRGELAFTYRLADGRFGVAVASPREAPPTAIPLPSALPAAAVLIAAFGIPSTLRRLRASMPA
jgi:hypothetical protein